MSDGKATPEQEQISIPAPKKTRFGFLNSKAFWIFLVAVLVGGWWLSSSLNSDKGAVYETEAVAKGDVLRTVEVTGEVVPEARLSLAFKSSGSLESINARVGTRVQVGDVIAELESRDLRFAAERARASLAIAVANLNAKLAGSTKQSVQIAQAAVDQARASYEKAKVDLDVTKQTSEDTYTKAKLAYDLAEMNLANSGQTAEQTVVTSFETLRATLQTALGPMRNGLTDGDNIIGIDDSAANDDFESILGLFDRPSLEQAKMIYPAAKVAANEADTLVRGLSNASNGEAILDAALKTRSALEQVQLYLTFVQKTLAGTVTNSNLTSAELDAYKSGTGADITAIGAQISSVVSVYENARNADLTRQTTIDQLKNAYKTAKLNLQIAESSKGTDLKTAEAAVRIQEAVLESAKATLAEREAPPREVDVAALRAQVLDAQTAYNQAVEKLADVRIIAPLDGVVTEILPEIGELVTANQTAVKMIATNGFTVEALVPEADIAKVEPGQSITITLDAYGDSETFDGTVVAENADQTTVQEAIYYKIYVSIDPRDADLKSGMTANLTILTGERKDVLVVPSRSLRLSDQQVSVRVLEGGKANVRDIEIGLRGDEGRVEVTSGLSEGELVVTGEISSGT